MLPGFHPKSNRSPAQRVRFGKEEQQNERALTYKISRSKRYDACSDMVEMRGVEPLSEKKSARVSPGAVYLQDSLGVRRINTPALR